MRYFFCLFLWLTAAFTFAKGEPEADTFLYQISKPGRPTSYLLGTIHIGKIHASLPAEYRRTLKQVGQLVVETDEDGTNAAEIRRMQQMMTDIRPLQASLGSERIRRLQRIFASGQEPIAVSPDSKIKPWAFWAISQSMYTPKGYSYRYGIDHLLIQAAKQQHKPVIALEGSEQLDYFAALPEAAIIRSLDSLATHHRAFLNDAVSLEHDYRRQRARKIWAEISDPNHQLRFTPKQDRKLWQEFLYEKLLVERNQTWLPKLIDILPQQPTLIAVGSAHLFGEQGLIVRLRQVGYQVQPIKVRSR